MQLSKTLSQIFAVSSVAMLGVTISQGAIAQQVNSEAIVTAHNALRQEVGTNDLQWCDHLAKIAQTWADTLATREADNLSHRPNTRYGENIFLTSNHAPESTVVNTWGSEGEYFQYGTFPNVSTTGQWSDVGHYTQIIWKDTTRVGCGMAQKNDLEIWVCNYDPPGNFQGRRPY